jgi:ribosomal protein S12 methylthiotransferase
MDIDGHRHIAELIRRISDIPGVDWIRLHYAYPTQFPVELLDVIRERPNVCRYLDIAFQHSSNHILSRMHRHITKEEQMDLIRTMRDRVPGICIRTTLMVGFPGETDEDFQDLLDFVRWARFERMGAFTYSEEEGTYSALHYKDDIPENVKQQRLDELMAVQEEISGEIEALHVGKTMKVIVDRKEGSYFIGRTEFSSPDVDPEVLIPVSDNPHVRTGRFYQVKITGSEDYDLYGKIIAHEY